MIITPATSWQQFSESTQWVFGSDFEKSAFALAFNYFVKNVPITHLNGTDSSSPWGPASGPRTRLYSWMQAIKFSAGVNPSRVIDAGQRLKQFRFHGEPLHARGDWFTWASTHVSATALPDGQTAVRFFKVTRPIVCLESTVADAFTGWAGVPGVSKDYHHGGGKQLFIFRNGPEAMSLEFDGGAK